MSQTRSPKVRKILHLEGRGAALLGHYEAHLAALTVSLQEPDPC